MAQHKAAMDRISGGENDPPSQSDPEKGFETQSQLPTLFSDPRIPNFAQWALHILPLCWCIMIIGYLTRYLVLHAWFMPFIGILAATLANSVPVGGGIVFVPALMLLGQKIKLGVAFTVATMTFGNGVFGFLNWLKKDPTIFVWGSFKYTVPTAWIGAIIGTMFPLLSGSACKYLFGFFSIAVAIVVVRAARNGGVVQPLFEIASGKTEDEMLSDPNTFGKLMVAGFFTGLILVSNIGIGNAMMTFVTLTSFVGIDAKRAIVTGIITGGWTSLVPFLVHLIVIQDVPVALWLMVLPGVYMGAKVAPAVHSVLGLEKVLYAFGAFLLATAGLMFSTA
mmetsp:Transcript_25897/g.33969  ORF Transcript_25897/g.33969 Transcript_25897/m.33969 type:complete len:336 (-) Transcript_25897:274-1281(-)